ncbi:hypothetical protein ARMGADRAFT_1014955 [Armillaria gallica]|uniref:Uncharacterized protein n=1 Tax=Armillaria gallica TaxID=47427 RepID=A0A2H3D3E4_ARMGA|nr:hypothetical protein ARMGADRAFT_1014955 [Armillaria gallica]
MAIQTDTLSDLTDDDKAYAFQYLDATLNSTILYALLHGIYTGILAVTLGNTFINKSWSIRRTLVFVIILLHALITVNFAVNWSYVHSAFIGNGQSFWTVYLKFNGPVQAFFWESGITATIGTILADLYIIWCCWMVWGRRWLVVLLPILSQICATVSKIIHVYREYFNPPEEIFSMLYISFVLVTTLWCTLLIIYRILIVTGVKWGGDGRLRVYQHFIEVLVESSALYSVSLLVFLALTIRGDLGMYYFDVIAGLAKGVAPTLLIGRAAAGHTRPKDDCDESAVSALRFQTLSELCTMSFQETTMQSTVIEKDIEAQPEPLVVFVEKTQWCS